MCISIYIYTYNVIRGYLGILFPCSLRTTSKVRVPGLRVAGLRARVFGSGHALFQRPYVGGTSYILGFEGVGFHFVASRRQKISSGPDHDLHPGVSTLAGASSINLKGQEVVASNARGFKN